MRHELAVVASADTEHMMMECKFHSMQGKMSDVKDDYNRLNAMHIPDKRIQLIKKEREKLIL